jgi:thiol-disulfide isomerase/thioredoxin
MHKNNLLFSIVLLFLLLNTSSISSSLGSESSDAIVLTHQNFNSKVQQYDVLLVMFHVKWCPHCRRLHPEYDRASTILLKNVDYPIYLAKLDCTNDDEAQCGRRYNIHGFPTLRIYRYGRFTGEELNHRNRTTDELVKTMKALKKGSEQQVPTWYNRSQTDGVEDEMNTATTSVQNMWLLMGLLIYII